MEEPTQEEEKVIAVTSPEEAVSIEPKDAVAEKPLPWFKKKKIIGTGVALVALLIVGLFILMSGDSVEAPTIDDAAQSASQEQSSLAAAITLIEGAVEQSSDGEDWEEAERGATVNQGEYVRTAADSRAILLLDDGSAVRLDNNSEVQLTTVDADGTDAKLIAGQIYSRVIKSESRTFAISTDTERFIAKGTAFKTATDDTMDSLEVYHSAVEVESENKQIEEGNKYDTDTKKKVNIDLDTLKSDEFVQWNKDQDSKDSDFKNDLGVLAIETEEKEEEEEITEAPVAPTGITLNGSKAAKGVQLSWSTNGTPASDGFKVVFSASSPTPTYNVHDAQYVGPGKTSYTVDIADGKTYNFRICAYKASNSTCSSYSNTVTVAAPLVQKEAIKPGAVSITLAEDNSTISWTTAGTAPHGYKVLLSTTSMPTYPGSSIQFVGAGSSTATLPEKPAGTYYVRVCKYTADTNVSGGCTDYSNQIKYIVSAEGEE